MNYKRKQASISTMIITCHPTCLSYMCINIQKSQQSLELCVNMHGHEKVAMKQHYVSCMMHNAQSSCVHSHENLRTLQQESASCQSLALGYSQTLVTAVVMLVGTKRFHVKLLLQPGFKCALRISRRRGLCVCRLGLAQCASPCLEIHSYFGTLRIFSCYFLQTEPIELQIGL